MATTVIDEINLSFVIGHWSLVIGHWSLVIGCWSFLKFVVTTSVVS
jgi:hypothetical protein